MRFVRSSFSMRIPLALLATAVAAMTVGASSYEFSPVGKEDRLPSVADCRDAKTSIDPGCSGVDLPETSVETYTVAPGFSIATQVNG